MEADACMRWQKSCIFFFSDDDKGNIVGLAKMVTPDKFTEDHHANNHCKTSE